MKGDHRTPAERLARWRRRHRRARSAIVGAMLFVPHAGKHAPPATSAPTSFSRPAPAEPFLQPEITVTTTFRLPIDVEIEALIQEAAVQHHMDPALIRAVVRTESAFDPDAVSTAGAQGLMQLMPALSQELGVEDPFDPRQNIFAGVRYLRFLLDAHNGNESLALASYNAGPGAVALHGGIPPFRETQQYVKTITGMLARDRGVTTEPADER